MLYSIKDFLEVKSAWCPSFSPDGSKLVYLSNITGIAQIYLISRVYGESIQLTNSTDSITFAMFSPTENIIIFGKSEGGNENNQLYLINPETKDITPLTNNKNSRYDFGSWSDDGKLISYSSTERNGKDFDVYILDIKTKKIQNVYQEGGWCKAGTFSPKGTYLSIKKSYSNTNSDTYIYNLHTKKIECITPHSEPMLQSRPVWLPDESALFMVMNQDQEFMSLTKYTFDEQKFEFVFTPGWDVDAVSMQKDAQFIAITINEEGYNKVIIKDPFNLKDFGYNFPKGEVSGISFSRDSKFMTFSLGDSTKTRDIWILEMQTRKYIQLTHSTQKVPSEVMIEPTLIKYDSFDGLKVPAFIYKPKITNNEKLPVIINIHGGPESQYQPGYAPITQYLVNNGYVVIAPNIRGSSGYGKTYLSLDDIDKRMDAVKDIVSLREYLKTIPEIDTNKVVLMGGSYGGFMVLACLAFYPDLWAAGINTVGISNLVTFLENTAPYRRALREVEYGYLEKDREFLKSISPINSVEKIKAPLFIIHGANDPRVPLLEAEQIESELKKLGRTVEMLVYPDEGHGLSKLVNRLDAYPRMVDFLKKHL